MRKASLSIVLWFLSTTYGFAADLELRKFAEIQYSLVQPPSAPPTVLRPGGLLLYSLAVTNHGPETATNIQIVDPLPLRVVFDSLTPAASSCTAPPAGATGMVTCPVASLPAGATQFFNFTVRLRTEDQSYEPLVNTATMTSTTADPNLGNNAATVSVNVEPLAVPVSREVLLGIVLAIAVIGVLKLAR